MKHTPETKHRAMLLDFWNEFLAKSTMTNSPDFWSVGHLVTKTLTSSLSWKTEVCVTTVRGNTVPKDAVMQTSMNFRVRSRRWKTRNQRCKAAWHVNMESTSILVGNTRSNVDKQFFPSLVTDSLWTVKFDADGKVLKRHEHEGDVEHRDSKRVRFTHKQPDKRADMEVTDDTVAKRAKLFDPSSSSSSSSHEIAPNLHDSSGEVEDPETRESVMKKSRVDADMEISAIEALTNAMLEVDRALDKANKTLHHLLEEDST